MLVASCVWLFVTPWTEACQSPLSIGFSRQEYWSGLLLPPARDLPDTGIEPTSPALAGRFFTTETPGFSKEFHTGQHLHIPLFHLCFHKIRLLSKMPAGLWCHPFPRVPWHSSSGPFGSYCLLSTRSWQPAECLASFFSSTALCMFNKFLIKSWAPHLFLSIASLLWIFY